MIKDDTENESVLEIKIVMKSDHQIFYKEKSSYKTYNEETFVKDLRNAKEIIISFQRNKR